MHRALSWLKRSEMADDGDGRYGLSEQATFMGFLEKRCALDTGKRIDNLVWREFSGGRAPVVPGISRTTRRFW